MINLDELLYISSMIDIILYLQYRNDNGNENGCIDLISISIYCMIYLGSLVNQDWFVIIIQYV